MTTTSATMNATAKAKEAVAKQLVREFKKPKGPTMGQLARKPRVLLKNGRDVS